MSEASPLSAPQSPLVGRGGDLLAIAKWLDEGARIVTVTGPVGIGKSRVALEVARRAAAGGASVAIAACGAAAEAETLCDAVASALAMEEEEGAGDPVLRIARALSARGDFVLVLDELDSIGPRATPILARWLALAPELAILVAARGRTHVAGEIVHELGPLPEAEALFFACAQRVRAGFSPSDADREHARAIVEALDGVPLAIELAAARMSVMGTRALLHRIGSGAERGLARAIDAAWSALDPIEQRALAELTVLRAPFTVDAAEAIVDVERPAVDVISALRDKSLLLARED